MRKAIEAIPTEERTKEIVMNSGQDPIMKTLGISWNSTEDVFTVTSFAVYAGPLYTVHDRRGGCAFLLAWKLEQCI